MRWRATVFWPAKGGDTMLSRQCVPPPGCQPACPACFGLSSISSTSSGSSAARRSRILASTSIFLFDEAGKDQRLREHEEQHQAHAAEQLEVDPVVGGEVVRHVEVEGAHQGEEADPAQVEARPDR